VHVSRRSLATALAVAVLSAVFLLAVRLTASADTGEVDHHGAITRVEYSRQKAVPGFDTSIHVVTDHARLRTLETALHDHDWSPGRESWNDDGCSGGTRTTMTIVASDGTTRGYDGYACGDASPAIVGSVNAIVDRW